MPDVDVGLSMTLSSVGRRPPCELLPNDVWIYIIEQLDFLDKLALQQTCRLFDGLLGDPISPTTWGRLELDFPRTKFLSDFLRLSSWVQRRLKGISTLYYNHGPHQGPLHPFMPSLWRELVALTANSGIRLRLSGRPFTPGELLLPPSRIGPDVQPPAWTELMQRLTALDTSVACPADVDIVCSLSALRHLQMECPVDADSRQLLHTNPAHRYWHWQLNSLRTLQLTRVPPAVIFLPGTAARLQHLHSLRLDSCHLPAALFGSLPSEMLQLPVVSRLELMQLPLRMMPDLRGLPALRSLLVCGKDGRPSLDAKQRALCSAELRAALIGNPLGAADGLTKVVLHGIAVPTQECADAIERLPDLRVQALDRSVSKKAARMAHALKRRLWGRCKVKRASKYVHLSVDGPVITRDCWPDDEDW